MRKGAWDRRSKEGGREGKPTILKREMRTGDGQQLRAPAATPEFGSCW